MPRRTQTAKSGGVSPAQMRALREEAIQALQDMENAIILTRNQLKVVETVMRRARRMLESGKSANEAARLANAAQNRSNTSAVIRGIQAARHRAQQTQFKVAAAEGATMAEIARAWGVSRQLVSRMVKETTPRRRL